MYDEELSLSNYINLFCEGWQYFIENEYTMRSLTVNSYEVFMQGFYNASH